MNNFKATSTNLFSEINFILNVTLTSFYFNLTLIWQNTKTSGNQAQQVLARYDGSSKVKFVPNKGGP